MSNDTVKIQERILLTKVINKKDRKALSQLHSIYYSRLKHYINSHINSFSDTEDLVQSVFLELCKGNGRYDGQGNAEVYLFGVARNIIRRYHSKKKKQPQTVTIGSIEDIVVYSDVQQHRFDSLTQLKKHVEKTIEQLPPKAKEAVRLRLIGSLDSKKAAEKIGCSTEIFYRRFYEGLKLLKEKSANISR